MPTFMAEVKIELTTIDAGSRTVCVKVVNQ